VAREKARAEKERERSEWLLYASRIALAQREWQDNNVAHARDLLDSCRWDLRGWEHAYLRHLPDETQQTFQGHGHVVLSVCFSPDGKHLARGAYDRVKVWNAQTVQEVLTLKGHTWPVGSVCFRPDGKQLASASVDWMVKVWILPPGRQERRVRTAGPATAKALDAAGSMRHAAASMRHAADLATRNGPGCPLWGNPG
jgi:WD40 repeat protein